MNTTNCENKFLHAFKRDIVRLLILAAILIGETSVFGQSQDTFSSINLGAFSDQTGVLPLSGTNFMTLRTWSDPQLAILAGALDEVPTIPFVDLPKNRRGLAMGGTFWSLQEMAPLPADTAGVNVWQMADGSFLLDDLNFDYNALSASSMGMTAMHSGLNGPVTFGGGGTFGPDDRTNSISPPNYGTNLWIAQTAVASGFLTGIGSNTLGGVSYTIQSFTDLTHIPNGWQYEGTIVGSDLTNWTPLSVPQNNRTNLFIRLRSELSSDGSGLPDWWEALYFGTNTVNPDAQDSAGDGYTIYQKYEMGVDPNKFVTPPAPPGFSVFYNSTAGNVTVSWQPSQGNVTGYTLKRFDSYEYRYSVWGLPTNTTSFVDSSPVRFIVPEYGEPTYTIYATYSLGYSATNTLTMFNPGTAVSAKIVQGTQGHNELLVQGPVPAGITNLLLTSSDFDEDTWTYTETTFNVPLSFLNNNIAVLPDDWFDALGIVDDYEDWFVQTVGSNGSVSDMTPAGSFEWYQGSESPLPFLDGRQQLAQNATFLLRVANDYGPLSYVYPGINYWGYYYYYPTYSYAGLYDVTYISGDYMNNPNVDNNLDQYRPFVENYFFHNFVFSTNDLDPTMGYLTTGLGENVWSYDPEPWPAQNITVVDVTMSAQPTYQFQLWQTNSTTFPAILDPTQTVWTCFLPQSETDYGYPWPDSPSLYGVSGSDGNYAMTTPATNIFGLPFLSARFAYNANGTFQTPVLNEGGTISGVTNGGFFSQTGIPQLKTVDYYFAQPASYPLPGQYTFSTDLPNNTNNLVAGFGQSTLFAGYAKQALLNGYTNVYSYLGQYFDQAYQIDSNGNVTTNSAGVISPYGQFVATVVGPVALVTMANWGANERGTGIVQVVKLVLDVNHDGTMDLSGNGPDNTSANNPYVFWANNNYDRVATNSGFFGLYTDIEQDDQHVGFSPVTPTIPTPDCNYSNKLVDGYCYRAIPCTRDLEDFTRLWVCGLTTNLLAALPIGSTVTLSWAGNPNSGAPTIDLFQAADSDGGIGYQTNETVATTQINAVQCPYIGRLGPGQSIPLSSFDNNGNPTWLGNYFIWCGVSNGTGGLTLTIADGNGNTLAQTTTYIQVNDIKQMYERWTVGDNEFLPPASIATLAGNDLPSNPIVVPFQYPAPQNTNTPYILHVHGYNMETWEKDRYAETEFKRLYWQGYQGRFGLFRWPTTIQGNSLTNLAYEARQFDISEYNAWLSAPALLNLLNALNAEYPGNVSMTAHSHGNVVAGEALKQAGANRVVNTYIAMQAAVPAHSYDPATPNRYSPVIPDSYAQYWLAGQPSYFNGSSGAATYVNFFNTNDWALVTLWEPDQDFKPDQSDLYGFDGTNYFQSQTGVWPPTTVLYLYFPGDRYTIFSYCDPAPCLALGAQTNVAGVFRVGSTTHQVDLRLPPYNFGNTHVYHSGEFRSDNEQRWQFWNQVLVQIK